MPDTGAPWNIPYVAASDLVSDWPTDNQTMAEAIADALDISSLIAQVKTTTKTDTFTTTSTSLVDVTGLTVSITPATTSSKILVVAIVNGGRYNTNTSWVALARGGTPLLLGDAAGSRTRAFAPLAPSDGRYQASTTMVLLDSPASTSALTYSVQALTTNAANLTPINRGESDTNDGTNARTASTITVLEVRS